MKLLVVEDDEDTASFVKYVLEEERYLVRTAASVADARAQLDEFAPDLVILDRGLPDEDGLELCRAMRADERYAAVPVLFLSARKSPAEIAEGLGAGADDYVAKPFGFVELIARVQTLLRRAAPSARPA
ncbi:MAG: response regulator transcription factor [Elusimicrobia bacterium]|nr:response regulator transcription factor [Elusimicrobiota bacterium]